MRRIYADDFQWLIVWRRRCSERQTNGLLRG